MIKMFSENCSASSSWSICSTSWWSGARSHLASLAYVCLGWGSIPILGRQRFSRNKTKSSIINSSCLVPVFDTFLYSIEKKQVGGPFPPGPPPFAPHLGDQVGDFISLTCISSKYLFYIFRYLLMLLMLLFKIFDAKFIFRTNCRSFLARTHQVLRPFGTFYKTCLGNFYFFLSTFLILQFSFHVS